MVAMDAFMAAKAREKGIQVVGCWWCLNFGNSPWGKSRPYWKESEVKFIGHKIACKEHYKQVNETDF